MGLAALLAAAPSIALDKGEFSNGRYTAPGDLFTVQSPLGANPIVVDSFNRSTGAVTFVDEEGALFGIVCTPSYDVLAGANNDPETDYAILRNWFRDATFPNFFESQLPGAENAPRVRVPPVSRIVKSLVVPAPKLGLSEPLKSWAVTL